jgi:glycosyltransferase involved in cell wall biosynthesis
MRSQSMPRFAGMLKSAYESRGHSVTMWSPRARIYRLFAKTRFAKWAGYLDQYLLFPRQVRKALHGMSADSLFVFCDQALGPWVPLVKLRPHVVHVHDLLALRSALGDIRENPTALTGRLYQRYIRRGFSQARHFICVSKKTQRDLHTFGGIEPSTSEVVYNGLNYSYAPMEPAAARRILTGAGFPIAPSGFLLNVGGNQWYKNRLGLIEMYSKYVADEPNPLPLWCISPEPDAAVRLALTRLGNRGQVLFFQNVDNETLRAAYSCARAFLFPSLAEGFGWPLVEAAACGCPVVTTDEAPMNEVAGDAAYLLPRLKYGGDMDRWATAGAAVLRQLLSESDANRMTRSERGREWANSFDSGRAINAYLKIYDKILAA